MSKPERLSWRFMAEALRDLVVASVALRRRSFEELVAGTQSARPPADNRTARRIERVIRGWARRLPWRPMCFEQALAAQRMLARRGYAATYHFGSRRGADGLEAHVWLSSGEVPVVGHRNAHEFVELARFPDAPPV
ncbi:lasso peptide biosynthesis B2 protein [Sphingomicrobium sp. XHP0239]|uniref:lasso peptide biosynthesis B2 protein n=1 Tax=Sphingomicrobium maritimum TaxID=3133972 RepID=UPI0031CCC4A9